MLEEINSDLKQNTTELLMLAYIALLNQMALFTRIGNYVTQGKDISTTGLQLLY